jgi:hypothetical protein
MEPEAWARNWPRHQLLLELASQYTLRGRTQGSHKLLARLEDWRDRMAGAPDLVLSFVNELCYAVWLLSRDEHREARHHVVTATHKARQVEALLQRLQHAEARELGAQLRRRSAGLQEKIHELLRRSEQLLARSLAARGPIRPLASPLGSRLAG